MKYLAPAWTFTKELFKNIFNVLGSLLLIVLAVLIVVAITPFAFIWKLYVSITEDRRKAREIASGTAVFFIAIASSVDKFGNCAFGGFLNAFLLKKQRYKFGNNYETVSEVLGWAERYNDLTRTGAALVTILDWIDPNHVKKSMLWGVERAQEKTNLFNQLNPPK